MRLAIALPRSDADAQDEVERGSSSFGASSLQEQQRFQRALEIDLARSIQQLEAVELARVHLALPKVSPFLRNAPSATAAVLVRVRPGKQLSVDQVTTIQTLVAASVPRMKRTEVQVLDPHGMLLGAAAPAPAQSQRLALEQDLARRVLAVLTPWLGEDRVSVQVTATLEDSETRQTVEQVRNVVVDGKPRPLEKTVRTTRVPEGRIQHINAIVVLGFDANATEIGRARHMAQQALGLQPARGDRLSVYVLPAATPAPQAEAPVAQPEPEPRSAPQPPVRIPEVEAVSVAPAAKAPFAVPQWALAAAAALLVVLGLIGWLRGRRPPVEEVRIEDFDAALDAVRNQVLADPRVTADVIKLWMRA